MNLVLPATWWRLPEWEMGYAPAKPRRPTSSEQWEQHLALGRIDEKELVLDAGIQEPVSFEIGPVLPEVLALDLNDLNQVLDFVRRFGPLGIDEVALPEWEFMRPEDTIKEWVHNARALSDDEDAMDVVPRFGFMSHRTSVEGCVVRPPHCRLAT